MAPSSDGSVEATKPFGAEGFAFEMLAALAGPLLLLMPPPLAAVCVAAAADGERAPPDWRGVGGMSVAVEYTIGPPPTPPTEEEVIAAEEEAAAPPAPAAGVGAVALVVTNGRPTYPPPPPPPPRPRSEWGDEIGGNGACDEPGSASLFV